MYKGELKKYTDKEYCAHMKGADRAFGHIRMWFVQYCKKYAKIRIGKYVLINEKWLDFCFDAEHREFISWCEEWGLERDPEEEC